jgi:dihydrofolate reductase
MRKIASGLFISLDGVTEAPNEWQFDVFDQDMGEAMGGMMAEADTALLGRVTYQEWADYWPTSNDEPFASFINNIPKYVVSTTLDTVGWQNSTLIKGDLATEITRLKQQPGKTINVLGSPTLVRSLLQQYLLDEFTLMVHPVVAGKGKRLFPGASDLKRMQLTGHKITGSGVAILTYQPK